MEQTGLVEKQDYEDYKEELRGKLDETAENFIVIGYILKQVRDRQLYLQENYSDIYGFGLGAFGLSKATVSRFMNINTKFSVDGCSREIKPEYKGYGRSKIQEMLNVDEDDMELVTAATTVEQVQELKKAERTQRQIEKEERENCLPLLQMAAGETGETADSGGAETEHADPFEKILVSFWGANPDLYRKVAAGLVTPEIAAEEISPSGSMTHRDGVNIIFFYDADKGIKLRSYEKGKAEIISYTYQELIDKTQGMDLVQCQKSAGKEPDPVPDTGMPEAEPVATLQPGQGEEGQAVPYTPVPGQTRVSDLQGVMPAGQEDKGAQDSDVNANIDNVIDGEYRELTGDMEQKETEESDIKTGGECPYTDIEIKNAISFFAMEYSRMAGMGQDTAKRRNYKIALECIRTCYQPAAEQTDKAIHLWE